MTDAPPIQVYEPIRYVWLGIGVTVLRSFQPIWEKVERRLKAARPLLFLYSALFDVFTESTDNIAS